MPDREPSVTSARPPAVTVVSARRAAIHDLVERAGGARTRELVALFDASPAAIRRDLTALDAYDLVLQVHGGAVRRTRTAAPAPASCAPVVARARRFARDGATVALSAGRISVQLARHLPAVTVVTYSLPVARAARAHHRLILTAGVPLPRLDVAFIELDGVDPAAGLTNTTAAVAELNRLFAATADRVVHYAEPAARNRVAGFRVADLGATVLMDG